MLLYLDVDPDVVEDEREQREDAPRGELSPVGADADVGGVFEEGRRPVAVAVLLTLVLQLEVEEPRDLHEDRGEHHEEDERVRRL